MLLAVRVGTFDGVVLLFKCSVDVLNVALHVDFVIAFLNFELWIFNRVKDFVAQRATSSRVCNCFQGGLAHLTGLSASIFLGETADRAFNSSAMCCKTSCFTGFNGTTATATKRSLANFTVGGACRVVTSTGWTRYLAISVGWSGLGLTSWLRSPAYLTLCCVDFVIAGA